MESIAAIIATIITASGGLVAAYWQWVYKPKHKDDAAGDRPSMGERALDQLLAEATRLQGVITAERRSHDVTREQYIDVVKRLATAEAEIRAARQDIAERDDTIRHLRVELDSLRRDIDDLRRRHAG